MPTVSTIIPAYNAAEFIRDAIDSALAQTFGDHEVIVVDDGSTDATPEILAEYGDRIRAIRQSNSGHVCARNRAAEAARGEWLAFLDADDQWMPEKLERQLEFGGAAMVYTDRLNIGWESRLALRQSDSCDLWEGDVFEELLRDNFVTVSSVVMRKDWFDRLGGFSPDPVGCEDWDLWLRLAEAGGQIAVVREALTKYRWHAKSMSYDEERMHRGRRVALERALASPRGRHLAPAQVRRARSAVWSCSAWHASSTQPWLAIRWYMVAACLRPWDVGLYKGMAKCLLRRE